VDSAFDSICDQLVGRKLAKDPKKEWTSAEAAEIRVQANEVGLGTVLDK